VIKLFSLVPMAHTWFADPAALQTLSRQGIVVTDDRRRADVYLSRHFPAPRRTWPVFAWKANRPRRPLFVWTHEPRFCAISRPRLRAGWVYPEVHVQNVYTRDLYLNNYTWYGWAIDRRLAPVASSSADGWASRRGIVALATYRSVSPRMACVVDGVDVDLVARRQRLIARGHARGLVDVFGEGWPAGVARGASRRGDWTRAKLEILRRYRFTICLENTAFDRYCTEKIWHAIGAGCLPIYSSFNNRIYDDFPQDSFIDCDAFADDDALLDYVSTMTAAEYHERLNRCIEVFNAIYDRQDYHVWKARSLDRTVERIRQIGG
jgi:hypothetical protein